MGQFNSITPQTEGLAPVWEGKYPFVLPQNASDMTWEQLNNLRLQNAGNQDAQNKIAPFEHRAYAREQVTQNPLMAPVYAAAIPAYQAAKAVGLIPTDNMSTSPSLAQVGQGFTGIGEGLLNALRN